MESWAERRAQEMLDEMAPLVVGPVPNDVEIVDWLRAISNQVPNGGNWIAGVSYVQ